MSVTEHSQDEAQVFPYLPHTEQDIREMLEAVGAESIDELFRDIPPELRLDRPLDLEPGMAEQDVRLRLEGRAGDRSRSATVFLGCGSYDHLILPVVHHILGRSELYTAYTPYQPEISQGTLQASFEFQSMICELTGLDVANASLYDGHTAASEACSVALNTSREATTILYSSTLHPHTVAILHTHFAGLPVDLEPVASENGTLSAEALRSRLGPHVAGVLVQTPNFFGCIEDYTGMAEVVHAAGALLIVSANPLSLAVLTPPGKWGADIAIGDTQPCGIPMYFGGPSAGYMAVTRNLMRRMPGRIVGQTTEAEGERAFTLTLQTREQHIRRQKAGSNICTNQALMALASTVYLTTLGPVGLRETALQNMRKTRHLRERLSGVAGCTPAHSGPCFNEFALRLSVTAEGFLERMEQRSILAGVPLTCFDDTADPNTIIVAVTEKRTRQELDRYVEAAGEVCREAAP